MSDFERLVLTPELTEKLRHVALALSRNPLIADELVQEAQYRALRRWHQFRPGEPPLPWVRRILVNAWCDRLRRAKRRLALHGAVGRMQARRDTDEVLVAVLKAEAELAVRRAIARLPSYYQRVLELQMAGDFSMEAMGVILGCPEGTVRSRLHRARDAFRQLYLRAGGRTACTTNCG